MGAIFRPVYLDALFEKFKIRTVIETGTGTGTSISYLCDNFSHLNLDINSVELTTELYAHCIDKFKPYNNVTIINGLSEDALKVILDRVSSEPILYWLDAHYPGADFNINGATYTSEPNLDIRLPLQKELEAIMSKRDISNDVFILDDLRIYKDGPYQNGNCNRAAIGADGNQFVYDLFDKTHNIFETYVDEGYTLLFPKDVAIETAKIII